MFGHPNEGRTARKTDVNRGDDISYLLGWKCAMVQVDRQIYFTLASKHATSPSLSMAEGGEGY